MTIFDEEGFCVSYRFREAREKAGLSAAEVGRRIGVSQPAVTQWETGVKVPSVEMLCKLAELYCVSTDYLLGRDEKIESIPCSDEILPLQALRILNGKPVWDESRGCVIVYAVNEYRIFI